MNVKEYISSGIVESYVLGLVNAAERQEFEALCEQYPEIVVARNTFELALEEQLLGDAKQPPRELRQEIMSQALRSGPEQHTEATGKQSAPVRTMSAWKWLAAASILLLAGTLYWAVSINNENQQLAAANKQLEDRLSQSTTQLNQMKNDAEMLQRPGVKMAALKGTPQAPQALATIYWDTASATKDVYLMVNNLPAPASGKQYQLWALLNGKPIDLGVFDMQQVRQNRLLVKMQNVQNAQAFAITLEPLGGSSSPTMDAMYVMGSL